MAVRHEGLVSDPRLTAARADLAAEKLRGTVEAPRYARGIAHRVTAEEAPIRATPDAAAAFTSALLHGEPFTVYDEAGGWAWGQSGLDGYVGYVPASALAPAAGAGPDHRVAVLFAQTYAAPKLKLPPSGRLGFGARVSVAERAEGYALIGPDLWVAARHLAPLDSPAPDFVAVAEGFVGAPYVWGGRSAHGLDCSALVQLALQAAGQDCPRDSDMQEAGLGHTLAPDAALARGDLIFWRGHVGIMTSPEVLLHANAHHMAVTTEPLEGAVRRIESSGDGAVTRRARLDGAPANG